MKAFTKNQEMFMYMGLLSPPKSICQVKATFWTILGLLTLTILFLALLSCTIFILREDINFEGILTLIWKSDTNIEISILGKLYALLPAVVLLAGMHMMISTAVHRTDLSAVFIKVQSIINTSERNFSFMKLQTKFAKIKSSKILIQMKLQ